jgi:hypothetical protein
MDVLVPLGQSRKPENSVLAKIMTTCRLPTDTHLLAYTRARRKLRLSSPLSVFSHGHGFSKTPHVQFCFRASAADRERAIPSADGASFTAVGPKMLFVVLFVAVNRYVCCMSRAEWGWLMHAESCRALPRHP